MVCADLGTSAKEVAASWLTVPEKMMLDFVVSAARSAACGGAAFVQPHRASHKPAPPRLTLRNIDEIFMCASFFCTFAHFSCASGRRASWHRSEERRVGKEGCD